MNAMPAVVVRKGGFFSALAYGFFGLLTTGVVCAGGVALYAVHVVDKNVGRLLAAGDSILENLPEWQESMPPVISEALNDRRDPGYRDQLKITVRLAEQRGAPESGRAVIEVRNEGEQAVSLLAVRVVLEDEDAVPQADFVAYAATPLALEDVSWVVCGRPSSGWPGALLPGETRRITRRVVGDLKELSASVEISELRVWTPGAPARDGAVPPA